MLTIHVYEYTAFKIVNRFGSAMLEEQLKQEEREKLGLVLPSRLRGCEAAGHFFHLLTEDRSRPGISGMTVSVLYPHVHTCMSFFSTYEVSSRLVVLRCVSIDFFYASAQAK